MMPDAMRAEVLQRAIAIEVARGARVESLDDHQAVLIYGRNINHVAHLIGMCLTCGVWGIAYVIALARQQPEYRRAIRVDPYGRIVRL